MHVRETALSTQRKIVPEDWKQELSERLEAHRNRRGVSPQPALQQALLPGLELQPEEPRNRRIADRVAARYANAPSYSELLAGEAHAAVRAATRAATAAQEAAAAAQAFLQGLDLAPEEPIAPVAPVRRAATASRRQQQRSSAPPAMPEVRQESRPEPPQQARAESRVEPRQEERAPRKAGWQELQQAAPPLELAEEVIEQQPATPLAATVRTAPPRPAAPERISLNITEEAESFAHDLLTEATIDAAEPIPANLIEFPRQLVAARRNPQPEALAETTVEGAWTDADPRLEANLRIQEAEESLHVSEPIYADLIPQASTAYPATVYVEASAHEADEHPAQTMAPVAAIFPAPLSQRFLAAMVDFTLVGFGFLLFAAVLGLTGTQMPGGKAAVGAGVLLYCMIAGLYQTLFLTFADSTPGMLFAQVGLCTFDDENLTRKQRQRRILATLLAATPLGLGLLWALFDEDRLGWQDRISHSYQRSYTDC